MTDDTPALTDPRLAGVDHEVVRHGPVDSLEEAAAARGVEPAQILKTMVIRRADDDYVFVLVPGDRVIDCLLYTSPSPRDATLSRMPSSA